MGKGCRQYIRFFRPVVVDFFGIGQEFIIPIKLLHFLELVAGAEDIDGLGVGFDLPG